MKGFAGMFSATLALAQMAVWFSASSAMAQDYTHPKAMQLPAPAFQRPAATDLQLVLDNGLVAYVALDRRAPLVTINAYIGVGRGHGDPGAAEAMAAALRRGPAGTTQEVFRAALADMQAEYTVTLGHEETQLSLDVLAEDANAALELMASVIRAPAFESTATAPSVSAASAGVDGGIDYASSLQGAIDLFESRLFEGHAFARRADGSGAAAKVLHGEMARGGNITLAVAGDIDPATARQQVRALFAGIAEGSVDSEAVFDPLAALASRSLVLADVDRDQGWVVIGHELPVIPPEDEAALHVMDYILGAYHLDSRLYRSSRELRGLTNDNSSFLQPGVRGPGSYTFRTYGRPEAVRLLIDVTFRQLALMRDTRVTDDELLVARGALVDGLYAERYATGLDAANAYAVEWLRRGSHDRSASYPERIAAVTAEKVQAAARKYIHPERMTIAVVGPLDRIRSAAAIEGEARLEDYGRPASPR